MIIDKNLLSRSLETFGISLSAQQLEQFEAYAAILLQWNSKMNLTAITAPDEIAVKHFVDSAVLLSAFDIKEGADFIDVGTGAGFPGVVIKILRPDIKLTLLDSLNKRTVFLKALLEALDLLGEVIHGRAEALARKADFREKFDVATARAVADLRILSELCLPLVKVSGVFAALKGPDTSEEVKGAKRAVCALGGEISQVKSIMLPGENKRSLVFIKKISHTSTRYPRVYGKITGAPL